MRSLSAIPNASGAIARMVCARLHRAGRPLEDLLSEASLTVDEISDTGSRIKVSKQVTLLQSASRALSDDLLGFRLSCEVDLREAGLFYYVLSSASSFVEAMRNAERYTRIVNEGITIDFNDRETAISIRYAGVDRLSDIHQIEFWMFSIVRMCRQMTGTRLAPRRFTVRHSRKATPAECRAFLGCDITYGAESDQIVLPPVVTQLPLVGADRHLHEMLLRYAEETLAKRTPDRAQIRAKVEGAIGRLLPHGKANASAVAREIGVSRRTLARLLSAEGLTYSMVLEQYKCDLATSHLAEGNLSISEIAWLLGYREVSAFTHAFKRWVGLTPSDVREGAAPSTGKVNS